MMQKFYDLPFSLDIHFGYRNETFTADEMDFDKMTTAFKAGKDSFDTQFEDKIVNSKSKKQATSPTLIEKM